MFQPLIQTGCILVFSLSVLFPNIDLSIPFYTSDSTVFTYPGYTLKYNEKHEQAEWVAYELTAEEAQSHIAKRTNKFKEDPWIPTGSATDLDYLKSGYDRGHLAPAADMAFSSAAMASCFYYSNMSPQDPSFNRGIWSKLEALVRFWANENDAIYVITGPILNKTKYPTIGPNGVTVPEFFYKVILDYRDPVKKGIAFILPNGKTDKQLASYACTIDKVEQETGIDFFYLLPDLEENTLESSFDLTKWPLLNTEKKQDTATN